MPPEKPARRMTLRQLLTAAEKCSRDLAEQLHSTLLPRASDCRDLTRPVRRKSHYPTFVALLNATNKLNEAEAESRALVEYLLDLMKEIREHARRERMNRR